MAFVNRVISRGFSASTSSKAKIQELIVVGGGLMGSGIAQVGAQTGHSVTLVDISDSVLQASKSRIAKSVQKVAKKQFKDDSAAASEFENTVMGRVKFSTSADGPLATADLLIEAVVEDLGVKRKLFEQWDAIAPAKTIFASNTSSLPIGDIASATKREDRFGGLHFFNPVPMMKLLEVVRTEKTSQDTFDSMIDFGKAMKKATVECKDTPGFIVNRLLIPYIMEALRMLERGDASARDIDTAMKFGAGYPMGPFELADYVGLDTLKFIMDGWHKTYPDNASFAPSPMLNDLASKGKFGLKSGEGFYKYEK